MKNIAVITDTDSSLPPALAAEHGIRQVPISVHFEEGTYTVGEDIDDALLFKIVDRSNKLPTTSAPAPSAFAAAYQSAFDAGADALVCVCVSSKVSGTYSSAATACEGFPGREIVVIDSLNVSMGQGFMALEAVEAARQGASLDEITARVEDVRKRSHLYAVLPTLKYLALSGRVGKFVAGMADTLNIKPVLTIQDGKLELLERVRTRKKAVERMLELVRGSLDGKPVERAAIIHINNPAGAREFQAQLCQAIPCPPAMLTAEFTPGLSVHAGSGVVGVVLVEGK